MSSIYFLLTSVVFIIRCYAHYPVAVIDDYPPVGVAALADPYPYVAVAPEPIVVAAAPLPEPIVEAAPVMPAAPVIVAESVVASAPVVAPTPVFPYGVYTHHYHPRTEVRKVVRSYTKEIGHVSDTVKKEFPTLLGAEFQRKLFDAKKAAKAAASKTTTS